MSLLCLRTGAEWPALRGPRGRGTPARCARLAFRLRQVLAAGRFQKALLLGCLSLLWSASACSGATEEKTLKYFYVNRFFPWPTTQRKTCLQTEHGVRSMGRVERSYLGLISRGRWQTAGAAADAAGLLNFTRLYSGASVLSPTLCQNLFTKSTC